MVNVNEVIDYSLFSLSIVLILIAVLILIHYYLVNRHIHLLYLMIAWLCFLINSIFYIILSINLNLNRQFYMLLAFVDNFFAIAGSVFIVFFGESISRKTPSIKKLIWFSVFIALYSYTSYLHYIIFDPIIFLDPLSIPEEIILVNSNIYTYCFIILLATGGFLMPYYLFKIYRIAPDKLKNKLFISFIGGLIFGIITPILVIVIRQASSLYIVTSSVGMLIIVSAIFIKNPKIAFILPFKVMRLSVIDSNGGTMLFSHNWKSGTEIKGDEVVSAMFQGITTILRESLGKGDLQEINLEKAIVIAHKSRQFSIVYILIATSASKSLKNGLNSFVKTFETKFTNAIGKAIISGQVLPASEIISETFSFLPD